MISLKIWWARSMDKPHFSRSVDTTMTVLTSMIKRWILSGRQMNQKKWWTDAWSRKQTLLLSVAITVQPRSHIDQSIPAPKWSKPSPWFIWQICTCESETKLNYKLSSTKWSHFCLLFKVSLRKYNSISKENISSPSKVWRKEVTKKQRKC